MMRSTRSFTVSFFAEATPGLLGRSAGVLPLSVAMERRQSKGETIFAFAFFMGTMMAGRGAIRCRVTATCVHATAQRPCRRMAQPRGAALSGPHEHQQQIV